MSYILFFKDNVRFSLIGANKLKPWIKKTVRIEGKKISHISIVFCSDLILSGINIQYLKHNTLTDIITFDYSNDVNTLEGEIYISIDRVRENAAKFRVGFKDELHRVIIHGVLHLVGYSDKGAVAKRLMREKENHYLSLR